MSTPLGNRKNIVLLGRRNSGKSSIFNLLIDQDKSIVADYLGTTTDPVYHMMELLPYGPVKIVDTAGIDDEGLVGQKRVDKTRLEIEDADLLVYVIDANDFCSGDIYLEYESMVAKPTVYIVNKCHDSIDRDHIKSKIESYIEKYKQVKEYNEKNNKRKKNSSKEGASKEGPSIVFTDLVSSRQESRKLIIEGLVDILSSLEPDRGLIDGLIRPGDKALLVVPIDSEAPKGRLILPQVQVIRECLDMGVMLSLVRELELKRALEEMGHIDLVITDSQVFKEVASLVDESIGLTSFSILFARQKGDIDHLVIGARHIEKLRDGDRVLIAESCSHTSNHEDIGTVKIPNLIKNKTGKDIEFDFSHGKDFKRDLSKYSLIIQCGGCMLTRSNMMVRINRARMAGVPITNYGVVLAYLTGALDRVVY